MFGTPLCLDGGNATTDLRLGGSCQGGGCNPGCGLLNPTPVHGTTATSADSRPEQGTAWGYVLRGRFAAGSLSAKQPRLRWESPLGAFRRACSLGLYTLLWLCPPWQRLLLLLLLLRLPMLASIGPWCTISARVGVSTHGRPSGTRPCRCAHLRASASRKPLRTVSVRLPACL